MRTKTLRAVLRSRGLGLGCRYKARLSGLGLKVIPCNYWGWGGGQPKARSSPDPYYHPTEREGLGSFGKDLQACKSFPFKLVWMLWNTNWNRFHSS